MKKILVFIILILIVQMFLFSSIRARIMFSDEVSYSSYNKVWVSPKEQYFSVTSLINNPVVSNDFDFMFTKSIGLTAGFGVGYQSSIFDFNRFVTIPQSINGSINAGIVTEYSNIRLSLSVMLRSSFQTARNNWISQLGGIIDLSYIFSNGLSINAAYKYLYNYNMISSAVSIGLGYTVGGNK